MSKESIPTLQVPANEDSDIDARPRSHREVTQPPTTIFKITPQEWNNVPKIVYEAIACIVSEFDQNLVRIKASNDNFDRNFRDTRQAIQLSERSAQDDNAKTNQQIETNKKWAQDKFTKMNNDTADKISRVMNQLMEAIGNINNNYKLKKNN